MPRNETSAVPVRGEAAGTAGATLVFDDGTRRTWRTVTVVECTARRHDTISAYKNERCRCPKATAATVRYEKRRQAGMVAPNQPATMTMRRLQALAVIGWPAHEIGRRVGRDAVSLCEARRGKRDVVTGRTAQAVLRVYRDLHDKPGPSARTRAYAARQGWQGPSVVLRWLDIDEVAVRRACHGEPVGLHRGERLDAVRHLHDGGNSYDAIARRLGVTERQVHRDLTDLGLVQVAS